MDTTYLTPLQQLQQYKVPQRQIFTPEPLQSLQNYNTKEREEIIEAALLLGRLSGRQDTDYLSLSQQRTFYHYGVENVQRNNRLKKSLALTETHPVHNKYFEQQATLLLSMDVRYRDISISDRKTALRAILSILCPHVELRECGNTNKRTFLVFQSKRFRTYGDAIKTGVLDNLILKTGTALLLKGCYKQAEERYDYLMSLTASA